MLTIPEDEPSRRLARSAYRRMEDMIFSGQLRGGHVINERKLAEELNVSRTPLRDALLMLESQGLLKRRAARFLEVHELSVTEYIQVLNVRRLLESEAARLALPHINRRALAELRERLERLLAAASNGERIEDSETRQVDDDLHDLISGSAGNPLMASMIRDLRRRTRIFDLQRMPERFETACREHLDIIGTLESGDPDNAAEAIIRHIDKIKAGIVRHIETL